MDILVHTDYKRNTLLKIDQIKGIPNIHVNSKGKVELHDKPSNIKGLANRQSRFKSSNNCIPTSFIRDSLKIQKRPRPSM